MLTQCFTQHVSSTRRSTPSHSCIRNRICKTYFDCNNCKNQHPKAIVASDAAPRMTWFSGPAKLVSAVSLFGLASSS
jgi:hypothetical protein